MIMNNLIKCSVHSYKNVNKFVRITYAIRPNCSSYNSNKLKYEYGTDDKRNRSSSDRDKNKRYYELLAAAVVAAGTGCYMFARTRRNLVLADNNENSTKNVPFKSVVDEDEESDIDAGGYRPDLPLYSLEELQKHKTKQNRLWVVYKEGVYDITDFIESHPGGEIILRAAGGSIEPFWTTYGIHKFTAVYEMLESLRIGNISKSDSYKLIKNIKDPYLTDPERHPCLKVISAKPFNAEPNPSSLLMENFITSNEKFYVRNHLPVPIIDSKTYRLEIEVEGTDKKLTLTLEELKKLKKQTVTSTIMCAGNRRSEMSEVRPVKGLEWGNSVIGNAVWAGVYLRDILINLGLTDESDYRHVQFKGLDYDPAIEGRYYGASVPYNFVMNKNGEVLIAYEMNGEPLPRDHGFPVRVIVPGVCGARNVKWLGKITVSNEESQAFWQQRDYKSFNPSTQFDEADYSKAQAIQKLPVTSAICVPQKGETVKLENGFITIKGYAYSGGGNEIYRVDVTIDKGITWYSANLQTENKDPPKHFSWTLWTIKIPVEPGKKEVEIWAKAMDSNHNTQSETFDNIWNIRGVLSNAYHRIKVNIA